MKLSKIIGILESYAPTKLACQGDNIGLQVGTEEAEIKKIILTMDLTLEKLKKIQPNNNVLIVTHHPLIFDPLLNVNLKTAKGSLIAELIKKNVNLYVAHTNLDAAPFGVNYYLGKLLGIEDEETQVLWPTYVERLYKVVVFIPTEKIKQIRLAMASAGAGQIGDYSCCSFSVKGEGTFLAGTTSSPYIGSKGVFEKFREERLEMIVGDINLGNVITAMKKHHPYDEVAYDVYPLANEGRVYGLGRYVELEKERDLNHFIKKIKGRIRGYTYKKKIKKLAYVSGTSKKVFREAANKKVDCLIIGEIDYHQELVAREEKIIVIELGHFESENFIFKKMIPFLRSKLGKDIMIKHTL